MDIKFCGMTRADDAAAAEAAGATHIGLIFVPASRRFVSLDQARKVASAVSSVVRVALLVEPEDSLLDAVSALPIDMLQLHGQESPERLAAVRARTGLPVMKAVGVRDMQDMAAIDRYAAVADRLLIDAKPPEGAAVPGGHGVPFDWTLLAGRDWTLPWMLAGGLTPDNVAGAIAATGAPGVDLASGVESAPGIKDPDKMRAFVAAARGDN